MLLQSAVNGLMSGLLLGLVALGLCLIFSILHIVNFAHGEMYMLGGYGAWLFSDQLHIVGGPAIARYLLAFIITVVLVAVLGIMLQRILFRRLHGQLLPSFIVCLGLILILQTSALLVFGTQDKQVSSIFPGVLRFSGTALSNERLAVILAGILLIVAVQFFVQRTRAGQAMRAVAQNQDAAALQGINVENIRVLGMAIGCGLAAAAGCLLGPVFSVNPYMGAGPLMKAFAGSLSFWLI